MVVGKYFEFPKATLVSRKFFNSKNIMNKTYEVKFFVNHKGYKQTVEADTEAIVKQKVLASIEFLSCKLVTKDPFEEVFGKNIFK